MYHKKIITSGLFIQGVFILAALFSQNLYAALVVNRSIITYDNPAVNREDVVVINNSPDENLYVQVDPYRVINPGAQNQQLAPLAVNDDPEFLVTPNRLVVAPGARSLVRFLNLHPAGDMERIYRVNLTPITPPPEIEQSSNDAVTSRLEVVVAYQILVIVLPENPNPVMTADREANSVSFGNDGNANYLLTDGEQCNPDDPSECMPLEDHRVYPGNVWRYELPFDGPFTYKVRTQTGMTTEFFR